MIEQLQNFSVIIDELTNIIPKIVALCAILATAIPETSTLGRIIHKLAFNFGEAKNA
jgi:hypothetical protein